MDDEITSPEEIENELAQEKKTQKTVDTIRAYKKIFESEEGQIVLFDMMKNYRFLSSSYNGVSEDTFYNEGQRSVIIDILGLLERDEESILNFYKESRTREQEYDL